LKKDDYIHLFFLLFTAATLKRQKRPRKHQKDESNCKKRIGCGGREGQTQSFRRHTLSIELKSWLEKLKNASLEFCWTRWKVENLIGFLKPNPAFILLL